MPDAPYTPREVRLVSPERLPTLTAVHEIRARHIMATSSSGKVGCAACGPWGWPCAVVQIHDTMQHENDRLAGVIRTAKAEALAPIREAMDAYPPTCDVHPDDDPIKCGWKRAVVTVRDILASSPSEGGAAL